MLQKNLKIYGIDVGAGEICDKLEKENKFVQEEVTSGNYKAEYNYKDKYNIVIHKNATSFMPSYTYDIYKIESSNKTYYASTAYNLRPIIANWYNILRDISIVGMLSILVYVGIRIIISSTANDKAKYKQLLVDWIMALCLLFLMHYIMAFSNIVVKKISTVLEAGITTTTSKDKLTEKEQSGVANKKMEGDVALTRGTQLFEIDDKKLVNKAYKLLVNKENTDTEIDYSGLFSEDQSVLYWPTYNFTEQARMLGQFEDADDDGTNYAYASIGYEIIYVVLVIYTLIFTWTYLKRVVYMAFLTMIAPLVALTYPIDKMNDSKAQAFNMWFKEYIFNLLIQPLHLLLYMVLVGSAMEFASQNLIYAVVAIGFMTPAEKLMRKFFGFEKADTPGMFAGPAGAALMMGGINKLLRPPHPPKGIGGGTSGKGGNDDSGEDDGNIKMQSDKVDTDSLFKIGNGSENPEGENDDGTYGSGNLGGLFGNGRSGVTGLNGDTERNRTVGNNGLNGNGQGANGTFGIENGQGSNGTLGTGRRTSTGLNNGDNSIRLNPNLQSSNINPNVRQQQRKRKLRALRNTKNRAVKRFVQKADAKKPIRKAVSTVAGLYGAAEAAVAAGVISISDPSKMGQNMMTAAVGGYSLGKNIGEAGYDTTGNAYSGIKQAREDYRDEVETDEEKKARLQKELIKKKKNDLDFQRNIDHLVEERNMSGENLEQNTDTCLKHGLTDEWQIIAAQQLYEEGWDMDKAMGFVKISDGFNVDTSSSSLDRETDEKINEQIAHHVEKANGLEQKTYEPIPEDEKLPEITEEELRKMSKEERKERKDIEQRNHKNWEQRERQKKEEFDRKQTVDIKTQEMRSHVDHTSKIIADIKKSMK